MKEMIEIARRITGHAIPARVVGRRPGDPPELVSGGSRARDLLGWSPERTAVEDVIGDAWNFAKRHPEGFGD